MSKVWGVLYRRISEKRRIEMVTYVLPLMLLSHFAILCLITLGKSIYAFPNMKRKLFFLGGYGLALLSLVLIFVITFFPFPFDPDEISFNIEQQLGQKNNFIPFKSIAMYVLELAKGNLSVFAYQLMGNIILFLPFGLGAYVLFFYNEKKLFQVSILSLIVSFSVELMQGVYGMILGYTYRSVDIDDLLLNTLGGVLGYALGNLLYLFLFPQRHRKEK